jgi:hypothetical protein
LLLHKPLRFVRCPFDTHAMVHHRIFRADHTYHVQNKTDEAKIPMTWWNGPVLILVACLPFTAMAALTSGWLLLGAFVAACTYYATYEYLHWCMHKPKRRVVERSGIFSSCLTAITCCTTVTCTRILTWYCRSPTCA